MSVCKIDQIFDNEETKYELHLFQREDIRAYDSAVLDILLMDRTTNKNIILATNDYEQLGDFYRAEYEICFSLIKGTNTHVIQPRISKSRKYQNHRIKSKAEVFTPSWICNAQNNLIDTQWFGRENVFNIAFGKSWIVNSKKIEFPNIKSKKWTDYVDARRLEITCGEAPYLVSRYDTVTAKPIKVERRIGLLDRKLRIVNENTDTEKDWFDWVVRAYQSTYGYEYHGDSLFLARENLLYTFIDNLEYKFNRKPTIDELKEVATIISWNLWQMDGFTFTAPYSDVRAMKEYEQMIIFQDESKSKIVNRPKFCLIRDWQAYRWKKKSTIEYRSLLQDRNEVYIC